LAWLALVVALHKYSWRSCITVHAIVKEVEAANQSDSEGSTVEDVPSKAGQAKEGV